VLIGLGLVVLPRVVDLALRYWGGDPVARYLVVVVGLLLMAMVAQVFGIEGIVGAFFAGLALNRLVPNEGPSMERVEFFGTAVFIPVFLVSIGLLLDPSVMFTGKALELAAYLCAAALGGKAIACTLAGRLLKFSWPERAAMYVLTAPQAAATLAVTLIGFEIGLFGTTTVNAVLVLILVSIVASALLTDKVTAWIPAQLSRTRRLGAKVLVVTTSAGPSDAAVRAATLLARPDGGHSDLLITRAATEPALHATQLRALKQRISRHGFEGHVRIAVDDLAAAMGKEMNAGEHSLVIVDDPTVDVVPGPLPQLVVDGGAARPGAVLVLGEPPAGDGVAAEVARRLADGEQSGRWFWRPSRSSAPALNLTVRGAPPEPAVAEAPDLSALPAQAPAEP
jgi:hypothetical protein